MPKFGMIPRFAAAVRGFATPSRLLLGAKTAVAAALAWYLAPLVPFAEEEYSYYAPLGVLVSMYPTFFESARAGIQALAGLGVGVLLGAGGLAVVKTSAPAIVAVGLVVCVGVMLGGARSLGAGSEWVPIAGLFVLLLGGSDANEFSTSYLVTMGFGVVVGLVVHFVAVPPLFRDSAERSVDEVQTALSDCLKAAAGLVRRHSSADMVSRSLDVLHRSVSSAQEAAQDDRNSEKANPRARRSSPHGSAVVRQVELLRRAGASAEALSYLLVDEQERLCPLSDGALTTLVGEALGATSDMIVAPSRSAEDRTLPELAKLHAAAFGGGAAPHATGDESQNALLGTIATSLGQIVRTVQAASDIETGPTS